MNKAAAALGMSPGQREVLTVLARSSTLQTRGVAAGRSIDGTIALLANRSYLLENNAATLLPNAPTRL